MEVITDMAAQTLLSLQPWETTLPILSYGECGRDPCITVLLRTRAEDIRWPITWLSLEL